METHILLTSVSGNPNVGLYGFANNKFALVGKEVSEQSAKEMSMVLKVPVHRISIAGTGLIGVFVAGNDYRLLLPNITFDHELSQLDKLDIPYRILPSRITALGNTILCNNHGALVSPDFSADVKKMIRQALNVQLHPGKIADIPTVGALGAGNQRAMVLHRDASPQDIAEIKQLLKVECDTATINRGSPYVRSGILCNDNGMVVSDQSWGPEVAFVDEVLFIRE